MIGAQELRFVFVVDDYEAAVRLFRDVFGLEVVEEFDAQVGRGVLLNVPNASLELLDPDHARMVNEIEVGRPVDDRVRIAVKVQELTAASEAVAGEGGHATAQPVETPWGDRNQRFTTRDGLQLTLFQPRDRA